MCSAGLSCGGGRGGEGDGDDNDNDGGRDHGDDGGWLVGNGNNASGSNNGDDDGDDNILAFIPISFPVVIKCPSKGN